MPGPWDKYGAQASSPQVGAPQVVGTPRAPDPFKVRDQQLQEEAAARAREDQQFQRQKFEREMVQQEKADKPTDAANTAAFLATRVAGGMADIGRALRDNPGNERPGVMASIAGVFSDDARNLVNNEGRQRIEAAQDDVLDAALTLGTGAAYSKEQLAGYRRSYFPQIGDTPDTVTDKQARLRRLLESAKLKAGPAAPSIDQALQALDAMSQPTQPGTGRTTVYEPNQGADNGVPALEVSVEGGREPTPEEIAADPEKYRYWAELNRKMDASGGGTAAAMGAVDAATLGFGDEITAGGNAFVQALQGEGSIGELYGQNINLEREFRDRLQQSHPYLYGTGQLVGGAAIPIGAGASTAGQLAKVGAVQGGAYGFGSGEGNALLRLPGAAGGAALGGAVGGAIGAAAPYAQNALSRFRPLSATAQAEQGAARPVIEAGGRQGLSIRQPDVRPGLRGDLAAIEKSESAGPGVGDTLRADREAMEGRVGGLGDRTGGEAKDAYALGNDIQGAANRHKERTSAEATVLYERAKRFSQGHKAEPAKTFEAVDNRIAELTANGETANAAEIKVLEGIKSDLSKSGLTVDSLQSQRRAMRQRLKDNNIDPSQGDAAYMEILKVAGDELEDSLRDNVRAVGALRTANKNWAERTAFRKEVARQFTGTKNQPVPPETAAARFLSMAKNKGDYNRFSRMFGEMDGTEKANVAASVASGLGRGRNAEFSYGRFVSDLEGMNPRALRDLYGEDGVKALQDLKIIAAAKRDTAAGLNHSNTGSVIARNNGFKDVLLAAFGGGVAGLPGAVAGYLSRGAVEKFTSKRAARMLMNPDFTRWLRQTPNSSKPEVINKHFARLTSIASRSPALQADAQALQRMLTDAFSESATRAAAGQQENDRR